MIRFILWQSEWSPKENKEVLQSEKRKSKKK